VSKILYVTGSSHSREETFCDMKRPPVTVRNPQEETACDMKKHLNIDIQMDEEEIKIAENVLLL
jgi:hypothetical protein